MAQQLFVTGPVDQGMVTANTRTANPSAEEEELAMPGLYVQQLHPQQEPIMEEDFSQAEIVDLARHVVAFGSQRLIDALHDYPRDGLIVNEAQRQAQSDFWLFCNSYAGGSERAIALLGTLTPETWQEVNRAQPLPSTSERWALINSIVTNSAGSPETWTEDQLATLPTDALKKIHVHYLPKDYSGNAGGALRTNIGDEQELQMPWGNFFDQKPAGGPSSYESPNNILRRLAQQSQNGNGKHHP